MTMAGVSALQWTCVDEKTNERQPRDASVDRLVAELDAMRARQESVERNRHGDFRGARDLLTLAMARIGEYAGDDGLIQRTVATLEADLSVVGEAMSSVAQKQMHYSSSSPLKMRDADGSARRRTARQRMTVTEADGHVLVHLEDGRRLLMATGSPVSLSEAGSVTFLGKQFHAPPRWASVTLATIRTEIAAPVDGLLGMDVLGRLSWSLDVAAGALWISKEPLANPGEALPVRMSEGVPVIDIRVDGRRAEAFLETGAWLSYMPAGEVSGLESIDTRSDFVLLPEPIRFRTPIYRRTIRLGASDVTSEFGVLPAHSGVAAAVGDRWIVGAQILAQRAFTFDAGERTVSFAIPASLAAGVLS
jgi:hypothetical protein